MPTISYTSARTNMASLMQKVCENHAPFIITRSNAAPVVMISLEDYEAIEETYYLTKSSQNATRLAEAIGEVETMIAQRRQRKKKQNKRVR